MKHARPDYQDKIICIQSMAKLKDDLAKLFVAAAHGPTSSQQLANLAASVYGNLDGGHIPADEPVMLFRGQDRYAPGAVRNWVHKLGSDKHHGVDVGPMVAAGANHADAMEKWPVKKVPDMPEVKE
jgi:hypothetical protein